MEALESLVALEGMHHQVVLVPMGSQENQETPELMLHQVVLA